MRVELKAGDMKQSDSIDRIVPVGSIETAILMIRRERVIIDADLARLYGVTTKRLNEQVKRNLDRFPPDFMFQLTTAEKSEVVANCDHLSKLKFSPQRPYAFTEHGAIMAATILNSTKAVKVSVLVVRAFVRIRQFLATHREIADKLNQLEGKLHKHDQQILALLDAVRQLLTSPEPPAKPHLGFSTEKGTSRAVSKESRRLSRRN